MTAGEAIERAAALRPGCNVPALTYKRWLREADGLLRKELFARSDTEAYAAQGADLEEAETLADSCELLVPAPYDALYPHYLCAQTDAALGETDRYAGEQAQYNTLLSELAAWLRRTYAPRAGVQWSW